MIARRSFLQMLLVSLLIAAPFVLMGCPGGGSARLVVVNQSNLAIVEVNVSPSTSDSWGANQIASSIEPGTSRTISNIPAGLYDLRAVSVGGDAATRFDVEFVNNGTFTWTLVAGKSGDGIDMLIPQEVEPGAYK